jgi:hypothetical protein
MCLLHSPLFYLRMARMRYIFGRREYMVGCEEGSLNLDMVWWWWWSSEVFFAIDLFF